VELSKPAYSACGWRRNQTRLRYSHSSPVSRAILVRTSERTDAKKWAPKTKWERFSPQLSPYVAVKKVDVADTWITNAAAQRARISIDRDKSQIYAEMRLIPLL
jgi:hypothetical protein